MITVECKGLKRCLICKKDSGNVLFVYCPTCWNNIKKQKNA